MSTKKKYVTVTLTKLVVSDMVDVLCSSGDLYAIDIYDDGWQDGGLAS
jgi:hypothetical protein